MCLRYSTECSFNTSVHIQILTRLRLQALFLEILGGTNSNGQICIESPGVNDYQMFYLDIMDNHLPLPCKVDEAPQYKVGDGRLID